MRDSKGNILEATNSCKESEDTYGNTDRRKFVKEQEDKGMVILYPKDNELFIDIDTKEQWDQFVVLLEIFARNTGFFSIKKDKSDYNEVEIWESKGGYPGQHVIITLPFNVSAVERIAYQAALGSDPKREILSLVRHQNEDSFPTIFVEKPNFERVEL